MTNLLLFVALATIIGLIIILAKTFKEKNVLKEDLKDSQETSESNIRKLEGDLEGAFESLQKKRDYEKELNDEIINLKKQIEVYEEALIGKSELIDEITSKHTDYLQTMKTLAEENYRLKQHFEQLTASIPVNKIETKSKKNRRV